MLEDSPYNPRLRRLLSVFDKSLSLEDNYDTITVCVSAAYVYDVPGEPLWPLVVDATSSGKTTVVESLSKLPRVFPVATLSEAALLPATPRLKRSENATGGLLGRIGSESALIVAKDFTSILSMRPASLPQLLAALREVYDGHWLREMATDGGYNPEWFGHVGFIGAVTEAIDSAHVLMSMMGQRFVLHRPRKLSPQRAARSALEHHEQKPELQDERSDAVAEFVHDLGPATHLPALEEHEIERLTGVATFVAHARTGVVRGVPGGGVGRQISAPLTPELPTRLVGQLYRQYGGLVLIGGEPDYAMSVVRRMGFDCIPRVRMAVLGPLIRAAHTTGAEMTIYDMRKDARGRGAAELPDTVLRYAAEDLTALGVILQRQETTSYGRSDFYSLSHDSKNALVDAGVLQQEDMKR